MCVCCLFYCFPFFNLAFRALNKGWLFLYFPTADAPSRNLCRLPLSHPLLRLLGFPNLHALRELLKSYARIGENEDRMRGS
jgi:hypothetical protein